MTHAPKRKILAISGSTRHNSTNHNLIKAIAELTQGNFTMILYEGLSELPHFNPDNNGENVAKEVEHFRQLLNEADGVIICTPEYAHGVPGTLKNAIDWTVSTSEFSHKPTMLITASTDGQYSHKALLEILRVIEAENIDELQLLIPFARTKINGENKITDEKTLADIKQLIEKFTRTLSRQISEQS
jgi:chromate reductase, NAD(P)H dehydrogenase (quinone)